MKVSNSAYVPGARLCDRIRFARNAAKLSQARLATSLGITPSAVAQWESSRGTTPSVSKMRLLATRIGVSFEWLATGEGHAFERRAKVVREPHALELSCFAQDLAEERLLERYRKMTHKARAALLDIADALAS